MPASELTLAEALRDLGYRTGMVGKWHLGHLPEYLPTRHGFESWFGIPYSNDMDRTFLPDGLRTQEDVAEWYRYNMNPRIEYWNVPLLRSFSENGAVRDELMEQPADQTTITRRYTEAAVQFVTDSAASGQPFFLYLAHSMPHLPLFRSEEFVGRSRAGVYGDVIEEIDWSVGEILRALRDHKLEDNTLVVFTSDNGPWLIFREQAGSAGPLRNGKATTFEGGMRVPTVFYWPSRLESAVIDDLGSAVDLFPTLLALAGGAVPEELILDGYDLSDRFF